MSNQKISVLTKNNSKTKPRTFWKEATKKESENNQDLIADLKKDKKTFKIVEGTVEKMFNFNGNNYIIATQTIT